MTAVYVVEVEPDSYVETNERVEDALTRVLSAGFGEPEERGMPISVSEEASSEAESGGEAGAGTSPAETSADAGTE